MTKIINGNNSNNLKSTSRLIISFSEQTISIRLCTKSQWWTNHTVHHRQELQAEADEQNTNLPRCPTRSMLLMSSRGGGEEGSGAVFRGIPLDNCISSTSVSVKLLYKIARPTIYFKLVKAKE